MVVPIQEDFPILYKEVDCSVGNKNSFFYFIKHWNEVVWCFLVGDRVVSLLLCQLWSWNAKLWSKLWRYLLRGFIRRDDTSSPRPFEIFKLNKGYRGEKDTTLTLCNGNSWHPTETESQHFHQRIHVQMGRCPVICTNWEGVCVCPRIGERKWRTCSH